MVGGKGLGLSSGGAGGAVGKVAKKVRHRSSLAVGSYMYKFASAVYRVANCRFSTWCVYCFLMCFTGKC